MPIAGERRQPTWTLDEAFRKIERAFQILCGPVMQKHLTHVIDEEAVGIFKRALPPKEWTVYDIKPDYGKDHKVELVDGGEHTGLTFWVQIKGQKIVRRLKDGTIAFKLERKDLDYHNKLLVPLFLIVVDVTNQVGYWVFLQEYVRTRLRNDAWRTQDYIQIHLSASNTLSKTSLLRQAVREAIRYMTGLTFHADIGVEQQRLEAIDPRFRVEITAGAGGRCYRFHSDEEISIRLSYKDGDPNSGKIEDILDLAQPVVIRGGEIEMKGSPLLEFMFERAGDSDVRLEFNKLVQGFANLIRNDEAGEIRGRVEAIPCKIKCGRAVARIEARLPSDLLVLIMTIPFEPAGATQVSMSVNLSTWSGRRLMDLPLFDQLAGLLLNFGAGHRLAFECFAPGQRVLRGTLSFEQDQPYEGVSFLIEILRKARAIAALRSVNPTLPKGYESKISVSEIQAFHEILIGDGLKNAATAAQVRVNIQREGLKQFLFDVKDFSSPSRSSYTEMAHSHSSMSRLTSISWSWSSPIFFLSILGNRYKINLSGRLKKKTSTWNGKRPRQPKRSFVNGVKAMPKHSPT